MAAGHDASDEDDGDHKGDACCGFVLDDCRHHHHHDHRGYCLFSLSLALSLPLSCDCWCGSRFAGYVRLAPACTAMISRSVLQLGTFTH